ncbi:MAG: OadG family protein [Deltaproteobacteria bacterium]|nr:OadG family protein [Deltaproteobacteria bacterium]
MDWLLQNTHPSVDWNYALITLFLRFFGVFFILVVIQIALQLSSRSVRYIEGRKLRKASSERAGEVVSPSDKAGADGLDSATIAVIAMALALESQRSGGKASNSNRSVAWSIAGRMNQVRFR